MVPLIVQRKHRPDVRLRRFRFCQLRIGVRCLRRFLNQHTFHAHLHQQIRIDRSSIVFRNDVLRQRVVRRRIEHRVLTSRFREPFGGCIGCFRIGLRREVQRFGEILIELRSSLHFITLNERMGDNSFHQLVPVLNRRKMRFLGKHVIDLHNAFFRHERKLRQRRQRIGQPIGLQHRVEFFIRHRIGKESIRSVFHCFRHRRVQTDLRVRKAGEQRRQDDIFAVFPDSRFHGLTILGQHRALHGGIAPHGPGNGIVCTAGGIVLSRILRSVQHASAALHRAPCTHSSLGSNKADQAVAAGAEGQLAPMIRIGALQILRRDARLHEQCQRRNRRIHCSSAWESPT